MRYGHIHFCQAFQSCPRAFTGASPGKAHVSHYCAGRTGRSIVANDLCNGYWIPLLKKEQVHSRDTGPLVLWVEKRILFILHLLCRSILSANKLQQETATTYTHHAQSISLWDASNTCNTVGERITTDEWKLFTVFLTAFDF